MSHLLKKSLMENFIFCAVYTLHFILFASTLLRISFEVLFLNLYLGALSYKKKEN